MLTTTSCTFIIAIIAIPTIVHPITDSRHIDTSVVGVLMSMLVANELIQGADRLCMNIKSHL